MAPCVQLCAVPGGMQGSWGSAAAFPVMGSSRTKGLFLHPFQYRLGDSSWWAPCWISMDFTGFHKSPAPSTRRFCNWRHQAKSLQWGCILLLSLGAKEEQHQEQPSLPTKCFLTKGSKLGAAWSTLCAKGSGTLHVVR